MRMIKPVTGESFGFPPKGEPSLNMIMSGRAVQAFDRVVTKGIR